MADNDIWTVIGKRAFAVSYALYRLAAYIKDEVLSGSLRRFAVELTEYAARRESEKITASLRALQSLVHLGGGVGTINQDNQQLLLREIQAISSLTVDAAKVKEIIEQPDLTTMIQQEKPIRQIQKKQQRKSATQAQTATNDISGNDAVSEENRANIDERQKAITDVIRQRVNCHLKDIQQELPRVSERTIRYDLQKLMEKGIITRIGGGGPFSYYRISQSANVSARQGITA